MFFMFLLLLLRSYLFHFSMFHFYVFHFYWFHIAMNFRSLFASNFESIQSGFKFDFDFCFWQQLEFGQYIRVCLVSYRRKYHQNVLRERSPKICSIYIGTFLFRQIYFFTTGAKHLIRRSMLPSLVRP